MAYGDLLIVGFDTKKVFRRVGNGWDAGIAVPSSETEPRAVEVDQKNGEILVLGRTDRRIYRHSGGSWDAGLAIPADMTYPTALRIDPANGDYLVVDLNVANRIRRYSQSSSTWGNPVAAPTAERFTTGFAIDTNSNNEWLITGQTTDRIYRRTGGSWDGGFAGPTGEGNPTGIDIDPRDDAIFLIGAQSDRLYRYFNSAWDAGITMPAGEARPLDVAIDKYNPTTPPTPTVTVELITTVGAGTWTNSGSEAVTLLLELVGAGGGGGNDDDAPGGGGGASSWGVLEASGGGGGDDGGTGGSTTSIPGSGGEGGGSDGTRTRGGDGGGTGGGSGGRINGGRGGRGGTTNGGNGASGIGVTGPGDGGTSGAAAISGLSDYGAGGAGVYRLGTSGGSGGGGGGYTRAMVTVAAGASVSYFVGGGGQGGQNPAAGDGQQGAIRLTYALQAVELAVNFTASGFGSSVPSIVKPVVDVTLPDGVSRQESSDITLDAGNYGGLADDGTHQYVVENRSTNPILRAFQLSDGARAASADKDLTTLAGVTIQGVTIRANEIYTIHFEQSGNTIQRTFNRLNSSGQLLARRSQTVVSLPASGGLASFGAFIFEVEAGGTLFRGYNNQFSYQSARSFSIGSAAWRAVTTDGNLVWIINGDNRTIQVWDYTGQSRSSAQDIGPLPFADWNGINVSDRLLYVLDNTNNKIEAYRLGADDVKGVSVDDGQIEGHAGIPGLTAPPDTRAVSEDDAQIEGLAGHLTIAPAIRAVSEDDGEIEGNAGLPSIITGVRAVSQDDGQIEGVAGLPTFVEPADVRGLSKDDGQIEGNAGVPTLVMPADVRAVSEDDGEVQGHAGLPTIEEPTVGLKEAGANLILNGGLLNGSRRVAAYSNAITELSGGGYFDVAIGLSGWRRIGSTGGYENSAVVMFPRPSREWDAINYWALKNGATVLLTDPIDAGSAAAGLGAAVRFLAGQLEIAPEGNVTVDGAIAGLTEGLLSGTRKLSVHSADPSNPTSSRLEAPVDITFADFTVETLFPDLVRDLPKRRAARNTSRILFTSATVDHPVPLYVAISDGDSATDKILWKDRFDENAEDPMIGDVINFAPNSLQIFVTID